MSTDFFSKQIYREYSHIIRKLNLKNQRQLPLLSKTNFERVCGLVLLGGYFENVFKLTGINFDNFLIFLKLFLKKKLIQIDEGGKIGAVHGKDVKTLIRQPNFKILEHDIEHKWVFDLNQFPCTNEARKERIKLFCEYFPINREIEGVVLGDDDRNCLSLSSQSNVCVTVFEKNRKLIKSLQKISRELSLSVDFVEADLTQTTPSVSKQFDFFMCDPPYTLDGLCCWIKKGYNLLKTNDSCLGFVFFSNNMLHDKWKKELLVFLSELGAILLEFRKSFNSYQLPAHYRQYKRAEMFAKKYKIPKDRYRKWGAWSNVMVLEFNKKDSLKKTQERFKNVYYFD